MIALDTNVLIYATDGADPRHERSAKTLRRLAEGAAPWGLPVFCLGEYFRFLTHPRLHDRPATLDEALGAIARLRASPSLRVLSPGSRFARLFEQQVRAGDARGNLAFDAQIVAVCLENGAREILTYDRDFARFPDIRSRAPDA